MSNLKLFEISTKEEADEATLVQFAAYHDPYITEYQCFHPIFGQTDEDRARSIKADQDRRWNENLAKGERCRWVAVRDEATGKIIGGCEWQVYRENPFPNGVQPLHATWWPEGEGRRFAERVFAEIYRPRQTFMQRPHVGMISDLRLSLTDSLTASHAGLSAMAVHPAHRGRGAGGLMMEYGVKLADEMNVEMFAEAKPLGRRLYERYGLYTLFTLLVDTEKRDASDAWRAYQGHLGHVHVYAMWRPKQGVWKEGGPKGPWDVMAGVE